MDARSPGCRRPGERRARVVEGYSATAGAGIDEQERAAGGRRRMWRGHRRTILGADRRKKREKGGMSEGASILVAFIGAACHGRAAA